MAQRTSYASDCRSWREIELFSVQPKPRAAEKSFTRVRYLHDIPRQLEHVGHEGIYTDPVSTEPRAESIAATATVFIQRDTNHNQWRVRRVCLDGYVRDGDHIPVAVTFDPVAELQYVHGRYGPLDEWQQQHKRYNR